MEDDEDDLYGRSDGPTSGVKHEDAESKSKVKEEDPQMDDDSGEDMDDSDSDLDIITERAPNATPSAPPQRAPSQPVTVKHERAPSAANAEPPTKRPSTSTPSVQPPPPPDASAARAPAETLQSGAEFPEVRTSTVDLNAEPPYEATGKPITGVDIDADLAEKEKPWRRPGQDQSDYFNYGFDEFTWTQYCLKQGKLRSEVAGLNAEKDSMMGGGPGGMPGMDGMNMSPEDMQQFMQMMAGQGADMSQMGDFSAMMGGMGGMGNMGAMGGGGGFPQQGMMDGVQPPTGPSGQRNQYGRGRGRRW